MKKALAILLSITLLLQCLAHLGVWGYYQLNKEYIAANLCENRDKPERKCCGKCYLNKQLAKVDDRNEQSKKSTVKVEKVECLSYIIPATIDFRTPDYVATPSARKREIVLQLEHWIFPTSIFHPPSVA